MTPKLPPDTTTRVEMDAPYKGFFFYVRDDPPMRVYEDLVSGDITRSLLALASIVTQSNAANGKGEAVNLSTIDGWREQRRSFTEMATQKIKEAWELPKASSNGSGTLSSPAEELSPAPTPS